MINLMIENFHSSDIEHMSQKVKYATLNTPRSRRQKVRLSVVHEMLLVTIVHALTYPSRFRKCIRFVISIGHDILVSTS